MWVCVRLEGRRSAAKTTSTTTQKKKCALQNDFCASVTGRATFGSSTSECCRVEVRNDGGCFRPHRLASSVNIDKGFLLVAVTFVPRSPRLRGKPRCQNPILPRIPVMNSGIDVLSCRKGTAVHGRMLSWTGSTSVKAFSTF